MSVTPGSWERCDGYGWPVPQTVARSGYGNSIGHSGPESRHDREDGPTLPRSSGPAEQSEDAPHLPHTGRSVCGGVVGGGGAVAGGAPPHGQDALRLAAAGASGAVFRFASPHLRAASAAVAGVGGAAPDDRVSPGASGRRCGGLGLHKYEQFEHHDCEAAVRAPVLPLRADLLELGISDPGGVGVVRSPFGWLAECVVGTRRRAAAASQRQPERGSEQPLGDAGVPDPLPRPAVALRRVGPADQRSPTAGERRCGVVARALQDRRRSGVAATGQSRLRQPRRVRELPPEHREASQRRPRRPRDRRDPGVTGPAGSAAVQLPEGAVPRRHQQPDSPSPQHLLGAQPADRRVGRGPALRRPR